MTDNTLERNKTNPSFSKAISKRPAIVPKLNRNFVKTQAISVNQLGNFLKQIFLNEKSTTTGGKLLRHGLKIRQTPTMKFGLWKNYKHGSKASKKSKALGKLKTKSKYLNLFEN
jgi:hypothetical protein